MLKDSGVPISSTYFGIGKFNYAFNPKIFKWLKLFLFEHFIPHVEFWSITYIISKYTL